MILIRLPLFFIPYTKNNMFMLPKIAKTVASASKRFGGVSAFTQVARSFSQITVRVLGCADCVVRPLSGLRETAFAPVQGSRRR